MYWDSTHNRTHEDDHMLVDAHIERKPEFESEAFLWVECYGDMWPCEGPLPKRGGEVRMEKEGTNNIVNAPKHAF